MGYISASALNLTPHGCWNGSPTDARVSVGSRASVQAGLRYLQEWTDIAKSFDIASGYFDIGALLALDGKWQRLDKIRILMGDEISKRTKDAFEEGLRTITEKLDESLEKEKGEDDFLSGVPGIVEAIRSKKIETMVYRKKKFHAKAYITHSNLAVVGSSE